MAEYKTDAQVNYGWGLTLEMTGKAPAVAKRIFSTKVDAQAYVDDPKDSAIEGLTLSVIKDTEDNNGVYFVNKVGTAEGTPGELIKLESSSDATTDISAEAAARKKVTGIDSDTYIPNDGANYISEATSMNDADVKLDQAIKSVDEAYKAADTALTETINQKVEEINKTITSNKVTAADSSIIVDTPTGDTGNTTIKVNVKSGANALKNDGEGLYVDESVLTSYNGSEAIVVSGEGATKTISLKLNSNDKVLTQGAEGLLANINLTWSNSDGLKLLGKDSTEIATIPATDFIKDGMLENVELVELTGGTEENPSGLTDGTYLKFTFNTDGGSKVLYVNVTSLIDIYKAGDGLNLADGKTFSVKIDPSSEGGYLTVGAGGLKLSGVTQAISDAITSAVTGDSGTIKTELDQIKSSVSGLQSELDKTQASAGLSEDGSYTANTSSNFISAATSLVDADNKLDAALKSVNDIVDNIKEALPGITGETLQILTGVTLNDVPGIVESNVAKLTYSAASEVLSGYTNDGSKKAPISTSDTVNDALAKLENGIKDAIKGSVTTVSAATESPIDVQTVTGETGSTVTVDLKIATEAEMAAVESPYTQDQLENRLKKDASGKLYVSNVIDGGTF